MKTKLLPSLLGLWLGVQLAGAQGTAFNYQGKLDYNGGPATGFFNFQFQIYTNATIGLPVSSQFTSNNVWVSNGLFNVTLDFGSAPFNGRPLWMQLGVAPSNQPPVALTPLAPRSPISPTPYAIHAITAGTAATATTAAVNAVGTTALQDGAVAATKIGSNQVVKSVNGLKDAVSIVAGANVTVSTTASNTILVAASGGGSPNAWLLPGNAGTTPGANYIGASDSAQVRLHATGGFLVDDATPSFSFGATRRQMLNLHNADFGFGVQDFTLYQRSSDTFAWFKGGIHNNNYLNPGGGTTMMTLDGNANLALNGSLTVDAGDHGDGSVGTGIRLGGGGSGEGIASRRIAGANRFGLDLYTLFAPRLSIAQGGNVGIGTTSPQAKLDVAGTAKMNGLRLYGDVSMNDNDIYVRADGDTAHGIGYRGSASGQGIDGPFVYGFNGGALGVSGPDSISLHWDYNGNVWVSNNLSTATLDVRGDAFVRTLTIRGGADFAEPFQMTDADIPKGSLVVIDEENPGKLKLAEQAYDTRVAGIISGANGVNAGITLHQEGLIEGGQNVALSGRVYALADAANGPIKPGDLLTSSDTPGHVMKVSNHAKAQGAIVGKAMSALKEGQGMVLVLVSLQ